MSSRTQSASGGLAATVARVLPWCAVYLVCAYLGQLSASGAGVLALVAPTVGVSAVWFSSSTARTRRADAWAFAGCVAVVVYTVYHDVRLVPVALLGGFLQVGVYVVLASRLAPGYWARRMTGPLRSSEELLALLSAGVVAGLVGATVNTIGFHLITASPLWPDLGIRFGRNAVSIFVAAAVVGSRPAGLRVRSRTLVRDLRAVTPGRTGEIALLLAFTVVVFWVGFGATHGLPTGFLLMLPAVWVGSRFAPVVGGWFGLGCSVIVVVLTLQGEGVFDTIAEPSTRAVMAQLLVATMVGITLLLALNRVALAEAVASLGERNQMLDLALQSMDEGFSVFDDRDETLQANAAMSRLVDGLDREQLVPSGPHEGFFHPDGRPLSYDDLPHVRAFNGEDVSGVELHLRRHEGPTRILEITSRLLPTRQGAPRQVATFLRDVTAVRRDTEALTAFAGVVAHDLSNPLTVVTAWAEALHDELDAAGSLAAQKGLPMLDRIERSALHMRHLLSDLLSYATARNKLPKPVGVPLDDLLGQALSLRDAPGTTPGTAEVIGGGLDTVWADPLLVLQLLDNLVGNAMKYVAPGVRPHVLVASRQVSGGMVEVSVADNGIGIPEAERSLVFESFHRAQTKGYAGTGLGLSICKQIVSSHGGTIVAEANPEGPGTVIRFTLPSSAEAFAQATGG